jgi:hypothetical protein
MIGVCSFEHTFLFFFLITQRRDMYYWIKVTNYHLYVNGRSHTARTMSHKDDFSIFGNLTGVLRAHAVPTGYGRRNTAPVPYRQAPSKQFVGMATVRVLTVCAVDIRHLTAVVGSTA